MKKNIKLITGMAIMMALLISKTQVQADHHGSHNKTNRVDVVKGKATKTSKPIDWRAKGAEDAKKYFATVEKIRQAVKAGKLTEKEARKKIAELRKNNPWVSSRKKGESRTNRADILRKFDKNKDGKLDEKERAEARKAISNRNKKSETKRKPRKGNKKRERPSRKNKK